MALRYTFSFDFSSDARIKQNSVDLEGGVGIIAQLRLRAFEYNGLAGFTQGKRSIGVIAQELEGALPDCVYSVPYRFQPEEEERDLLCFDPNHPISRGAGDSAIERPHRDS